jgi:hypothetical protein
VHTILEGISVQDIHNTHLEERWKDIRVVRENHDELKIHESMQVQGRNRKQIRCKPSQRMHHCKRLWISEDESG